MCGIAGILCDKLSPREQRAAAIRMISTLGHRGPDGWGLYRTPGFAVGHTRLSILDLARGDQPMMSERFVIAYNGEIYNYIELREELKSRGFTFRSTGDTEVILKAFEAYGEAALPKLNGQFAFLLWDRREKRLLAARDRYGVRPLYVLRHEDIYWFASEMKAFDTIEGHCRRYDPDNLLEHALLWNTLGDRTVFNGIRSIQNGTCEIYRDGAPPEIHRYYEIGESEGAAPEWPAAKEEFVGLLGDAVRLRLRSDVPVANYLSGGIDSSTVTHLTSVYNKERFKTFSVTFEDKDFDESCYQEEMVRHIGSAHHAVRIGYDSIDTNLLDAVYHCERPLFRTAPVPLFLLSRDVHADRIKVVLTGEAADEILCGYDSYKEIKLLDFWARQRGSTSRPTLIKKLYPHLRHFQDSRRYGLMRMFYEGFLDSYANELVGLNIRVSNNKIVAQFLNPDLRVSFDQSALIERVSGILPEGFGTWSLLQRNQFLEMKTLLAGYLLSTQGDRMSMAHSVEGRYPFLDHRLVERVFHYPDSFKLRGFSQKYLLRKTFEDVLPRSIINRPKLPYQAPDLRSFFASGKPSPTVRAFLSPDAVREYGVFDPVRVGRFLKRFEAGVPEAIGYRDNMLISFMLSAHMALYWASRPRMKEPRPEDQCVDIADGLPREAGE